MSGGIKAAAKQLAGRLLGEYRINWIVASPASAAAEPVPGLVAVDEAICRALDHSASEQMRKAAAYTRGGLSGFAVIDQERPVCVTHFAGPAQYDRNGTWPLAQNELALMDVTTEPDEWGKGHAVRLIRAATGYVLSHGAERCIAFIWWSNRPSLRAFEKAGWKRIGLSLEFKRRDRWRAVHLPLPS